MRKVRRYKELTHYYNDGAIVMEIVPSNTNGVIIDENEFAELFNLLYMERLLSTFRKAYEVKI